MWVIMNLTHLSRSLRRSKGRLRRPSFVRPSTIQTTAPLKPLCRLQPWEIAVHLAVAGDAFDGVFFLLSFFPRNILDEILDLI